MTWHISLIVALIAILGAFHVQRYVAYKGASRAFRSVIHSAFIGLYPTPVNWPKDNNTTMRILEEKFPALEAAVVEFRRYLPFWKRKGFDRAWAHYISGGDRDETGANQCYWQYVAHKSEGFENGKRYSVDTTHTYKEAFKRNIDCLLSYAKEI